MAWIHLRGRKRSYCVWKIFFYLVKVAENTQILTMNKNFASFCRQMRPEAGSSVPSIQTILPRYNTFICPRHLCPGIPGLFFRSLYLGRTFVWPRHIIFSYLSGPDKLYSVICLGQTNFYVRSSVICLDRKVCLGKVSGPDKRAIPGWKRLGQPA